MSDALRPKRNFVFTGGVLTGGTALAVLLVTLDSLMTGNRTRPKALAEEDYASSGMEEIAKNPTSRPALMLQSALGYIATCVHAGMPTQPLLDAEWRPSPLSDDYLASDDLQDTALPKIGLMDIRLTDPLHATSRLQFQAVAAHRDERTGFDAIALFEPISHTLLLVFPGLEPKRGDYGAVIHTFRRNLPPQNGQVADFMQDVYNQLRGSRAVHYTHITAHSLGAGAGIMAAALLTSNDLFRREMGQGQFGLTLIEGWAESLSAQRVLAQMVPAVYEEALRKRTHSVRLYPATFIGTDSEGNKPFGERVTALMPTGLRQAHAWTFWRENNHRLEHIFDGLNRGDMLLCDGAELAFESTRWARAVKTFLAAASNIRA